MLPYGISDYEKIVNDNLYYVDKTRYIPEIEQYGYYLFLIRPRRFGKSLFLSVLEAYYDIHRADDFERFFENTFIYDHPTAEQNKYLILKLNFSIVNADFDKIEGSFLELIRKEALLFIKKYQQLLAKEREYFTGEIKTSNDATTIFNNIITLCKFNEQKFYLLIDEYDNFTNTILSQYGERSYHELTHGTGFFRTFFTFIKGGTTGLGAPISRLFITGVSPVTMDDVTSGFNIGRNITTEKKFDATLGFTDLELNDIIEYYENARKIDYNMLQINNRDELLFLIDKWYGNYIFSRKSNSKIYNTDMCLFFLQSLIDNKEFPDDMLDQNIRTDYKKLRYLMTIDIKDEKEFNGNFDVLAEIIEKNEVVGDLIESFPVEEITEQDKFISLLFYLGLLTINRKQHGELVLAIPNQVIRQVYYEYFRKGLADVAIFKIEIGSLRKKIVNMAYKGEWKQFFEYLSQKVEEQSGIRDYIEGHQVIKGFLLAYMSIADYYIIESDRERKKGYADLFLKPFLAKYPDLRYSYLIELKYLTKDKKDTDIEAAKLEGIEQLNKYDLNGNLQKEISDTQLIKILLIYRGWELVYYDSM